MPEENRLCAALLPQRHIRTATADVHHQVAHANVYVAVLLREEVAGRCHAFGQEFILKCVAHPLAGNIPEVSAEGVAAVLVALPNALDFVHVLGPHAQGEGVLPRNQAHSVALIEQNRDMQEQLFHEGQVIGLCVGHVPFQVADEGIAVHLFGGFVGVVGLIDDAIQEGAYHVERVRGALPVNREQRTRVVLTCAVLQGRGTGRDEVFG